MISRFLFALLIVSALPLFSQNYTRRGEVYGQIGAGVTYDDEGSIGNGIAGGGGVGFRFTRRLGVEFDLNAFRHERNFSFGRLTGSGQFFTGNLIYHFTKGRVQPFILAGAGGLHSRLESPFSGTLVFRETTGFAGDAGAGVKIFANERLSIRPEVRVYAGGSTPNFTSNDAFVSHLRVSIGVGYHW